MLQQFYPVIAHPYVFELNKDMQIAAAHFIPHEDAGACSDIHGHTYFVNITIGGNELDHLGFLINFQELKKLIHKRFDHTLINNDPLFAADRHELVQGLPAPSTEAVASAIFKIVQGHLNSLDRHLTCIQVIVRETPTSYVTFRHPQLGGIDK